MKLETTIQESPLLAPVIQNWGRIQLRDCWLVAGSIAQTVWNNRYGLPYDFGISDVDLIYFDPDDLSAGAEQEHAERIKRCFEGLPVWFDVKTRRVFIFGMKKNLGPRSHNINPLRLPSRLSPQPLQQSASGQMPMKWKFMPPLV